MASIDDTEVEEMVKDFVARYGEERVSVEENSDDETGREVVVYETAVQDQPVVFAELFANDTINPASIDEVREALSKISADYGAVIAPSIRYVFRDTDGEYERTVPGLPDIDGSVPDTPRPFRSSEEAVFCFKRLFEVSDNYIDEADESPKAKFCKSLINLGDIMMADMAIDDAMTDEDIKPAVETIYNGFDLLATKQEQKKEFVNTITEIDGIQKYNTRNDITELLLDLAEIEEGQSVLDPAAGLGSILRGASENGASAEGVELDTELVTVARVLTTILGHDIVFHNADFLEADPLGGREFDHVIMEPPSTRHDSDEDLHSLVTQEGEHIEGRFLKSVNEYVTESGTVTALVPLAVLSRPDEETQQLREYLRNEYQITAIIEITNKRYYPYPGVRTAVIQLSNVSDPGEYEVPLGVVKSADTQSRFAEETTVHSQEEYAQIVSAIKSGNVDKIAISDFNDSFVPSDVLRKQRIEDLLSNEFDEFSLMGEIVEAIEKGVEIKGFRLADSGVPYLRVTDVVEDSMPQRYVAEADGEVIATESDLLVSIEGTIGVIHRPSETIVPSADWAILRFSSPEEAERYKQFLTATDIGTEVREEIKSSALVPYPRYNPVLPVQRLEQIPMPALEQEEIPEQAE